VIVIVEPRAYYTYSRDFRNQVTSLSRLPRRRLSGMNAANTNTLVSLTIDILGGYLEAIGVVLPTPAGAASLFTMRRTRRIKHCIHNYALAL
jgi:hypothetical protein